MSASVTDCSSPASSRVSTECFASPPEPLFYEAQNTITTELLQDTLELLIQKNESAVKEVSHNAEFFKDTRSVLFLFELCNHLGLTPDVQYRAAEIFHRFMVCHVEELYEHVRNSTTTESPIKWKDVEERLKHQVTLRAVSCIQLASKLSSHYHLITLNRARVFLSKCGFRYTPTSIVQSEVRILRTIKYRVHNPTPLEFVEALLGFLSKQSESYPVKQLHGISLKMLDLFYLSREKVYSELTNLIKRRTLTKKQLRGLQVNAMLLAASIVAAASLVVQGFLDIKMLLVSVSEAAEVDPKHIVDFAWVLMREVFTDESGEQDTGTT